MEEKNINTAKLIGKIVVAAAAVAGVIFVVATYGEQIVAWCKKILASLPCCKCKDECTCQCEDVVEEAAVEAPAEEAVVEEVVAEEAPAEEVAEEPAAEEAVAEEVDFAE